MPASVLPFRSPVARTVSHAVAERAAPSFADLPQWAKDQAYARLELITPALNKMAQGVSAKAAAQNLIARSAEGTLPSLPTLERWLSKARTGDLLELAPKDKSRKRKDGGWERLAHDLYILPSQLCFSTIAEHLRDECGYADATAGRVQRYLESLPAHEAKFHPNRIGPHYRRQNLTPHKIRDRSVVPVGDIYQGDGHALHYYVQHPIGGHHFTAELTPWMDIGSRYITGWWLGYAESAVQVLHAMAHAIVSQDHVAPLWHVDPGSGNINKMMCDGVAGFVPRIGAQFMKALPGNARGKGDIEGWFRWFEEKHGKFQPSFKGPTVAQEFLRRLDQRIAKREMVIPSWDEAVAGIAKYIRQYNERNQDNLGKRSPAALFEKLQRSPLIVSPDVLLRPREVRMARSYRVSLFNRVYQAPALKAYEGKNMQVEYDLHDPSIVWIYDQQGRFITQAIKVEEIGFVSESRLRDLELARETGRLRRLEHKADLVRTEARTLIDTTASVMDALEGYAPTPLSSAPLQPGRFPTHAPKAKRLVRDVDAGEQQLVEDVIAEAAHCDEETPEQRFSRWLDLRDQPDLNAAASAWMHTYQQSAECLGLNDVYEAFGYLPGVAKTKGSARTEPFANSTTAQQE